jgi:hypothetical protein
MPFGDDSFDSLLPPYLVEPEKSRLKDALKQFTPEHRNAQIDYSDFYKNFQYDYFLQGDLVKEIRVASWNETSLNYDKAYTDAIIISNTCDISFENKREYNPKQCLLAPVISFKEYLSDLETQGYEIEKIKSFEQNVKAQLCTNIFYLPPYFNGEEEYIAILDRIFWFPTSELNSYIATIDEDRINSLNQYGFYLFVLKLSYHICRLPEQCDREVA